MMIRFMLCGWVLLMGMALTLQVTMNASAGQTLGSPRMANAVLWVSGAVVALLLTLGSDYGAFWQQAKNVSPWLWLAGTMGAVLILMATILVAKLGAASFNVILLTGQVIGGLIIAHYGWFNCPVERLSVVRVVGALIMVFGAMLAVVGRFPWR